MYLEFFVLHAFFVMLRKLANKAIYSQSNFLNSTFQNLFIYSYSDLLYFSFLENCIMCLQLW
jgi:hypothetical protein